MAVAMFCSSMVLPAFGGDTMRPRWPLPMGATRSMARAVKSSVEPLPRSSFRRVEIDFADLQQCKIALAVLRGSDQAGYRVASTQVEAADLAGRHIDVIGHCQVARVR